MMLLFADQRVERNNDLGNFNYDHTRNRRGKYIRDLYSQLHREVCSLLIERDSIQR